MNWGHKITIAYILFGTIIFTMVAISMNQDIDLVAEDYYVQEIAYQSRIDQLKNTASLKVKPLLGLEGDRLNLSFGEDTPMLNKGTITIFSPIDDDEDLSFELKEMIFPKYSMDLSKLRKGLWIIKVEWEDDFKSYYFEQEITLP